MVSEFEGREVAANRLPNTATTIEEIAQYFTDRARQGLAEGWVWDGSVTPVSQNGGEVFGARTLTTRADGVRHQSLYILDQCTARGHFTRYMHAHPIPIVTAPSCEIEAFLDHRQIPYDVAGKFTETVEYRAATQWYGARRAKRSGCHYMNHIDEGVAVLARIGTTDVAMRAFCLHPLVQMDADLAANAARMREFDPDVIVLALEYRNVANAYLSMREDVATDAIALSPLDDVNDMLRADKVQNYKDFLIHHDGKHPRSAQLHHYFRQWLDRLDIADAQFDELRSWLDVDARMRITDAIALD